MLFIMPYNAAKNYFGFTTPFGNIGEAVGDWKGDTYYYERIQGIVVDTRYLMYHYTGNSKKKHNSISRIYRKSFS